MKKPIIDMNFINDGQLDILYHDNFWLFVFKNHRRTYIGMRAGSEIVQMYISDLKSSLPRPVKELKGFSKVSLEPGETKKVTFTINKEALSFFDEVRHEWIAEPGIFKAIIAASATDIRSSVIFEYK